MIFQNSKVTTAKSLGVTIYDKPDWSGHIEKVTNKFDSSIGAIKHVRHLVLQATLHLIYQALTQPHFDYPGPRGFSWFFSAWDSCEEPRSGKHESRSGKKEKPLVTLGLNLSFMQTPGSGSDPRARIGGYFYKHPNQYDWFVWLVIPRGR